MITLLGRTLDIPAADRVIGQQGDSLAEIRQFKITDPSLFGLSFKLDTETPSGKDIYDLTKTAENDCIILSWTVTNLHTEVSGDIRVQLRGFDKSGCVWHSFCDYFCVNDSIYTTEDFMALSPTEFEEMEQRVTNMKELCKEYAASAAEEAVKAAEGKADADLSNVSDADFAEKAKTSLSAGVGEKYYDDKTVQGEIFGDYETNAAIGEFTAAFGSGSTAGQKGYYMEAINFGNPTVIALSASKEKVMPKVNVNMDDYLVTNVVSGFAVGDAISIMNNGHYQYCSAITAINGNLITVNALPFNSIDTTGAADADEHIVFVPAKPRAGAVSFTPGGFAAGINVVAGGKGAFACGRDTVAAGGGSFAAGRKTKAGYIATASGFNTFAPGNFSFAANSYTLATGQDSAAFGMGTAARGNASFANGSNTTANGENSAAFGFKTTSNGLSSFACGNNTLASGNISFTAGESTTANGDFAASFGYGTKANGVNSFTTGLCTIADGANSTAFGKNSKSIGENSLASGLNTESQGIASMSAGQNTKSVGNYSFSANSYTNSTGDDSAAFGFNTRANGAKSFVTGMSTTANGDTMIVGGKFNATLDNKIVVYGNGNDGTSRGDAYTLDWKGNGYYAGNVEASAIILRSNNKKFKITVDDSGTIKATAI